MQVMAHRGAQQAGAEAALAPQPVGALEDRDPGPRKRRGMDGQRVALDTSRSQSSRRPIMIVITGPISSVARPSASRRTMPRSTASAAATAWATENETVALTLMPR